MALARIKTWNPGDTLTAADLNAEFNNPLNNPISLVSPTTGAINFQTSVAHTNLTPGAITGSSGAAGALLVASTAAASVGVWSTVTSVVTTARELYAQRFGAQTFGTALTSNNFSLAAAWGSSAAISGIRGTDTAVTYTVTAGNAGIAANPTVTATFADGLWVQTPIVISQTAGGFSTGVNLAQTMTASGTVMTVFFTPSTNGVYTFAMIAIG